MPKFSDKSIKELQTCDPLLQLLFNHVIKYFDCTILEGHRGEERQNTLYAEGKSEKLFPEGKHNAVPSKAVDAAPYINGEVSFDIKQCYYFAAFVMGIAAILGIPIRNGADWDGDKDIYDQTFNDLCHFEIKQ